MIVQIAQYTCICSHRGSPNLFLLLLAFCARLSKHYSCLSDGDLWCNVKNVPYFHVLYALPHGERFTDFDYARKFPPTFLVRRYHCRSSMIMMATAACAEFKQANKFYNCPPDRPMSTFIEFCFKMC